MGREIKRVAAGFDWPMSKVWPGFLMPEKFQEKTCESCGGSGCTPEATAISETFHRHRIDGPNAERLAWYNKIGQAEVDNLIAVGRLPAGSTAKSVNEASSKHSIFGFHDSINRMFLVEFRCKALGIIENCPECGGGGSIESYRGQREEAEAWEPEGPPAGDWWQVWETVSEGSPVTPAFAADVELVDYLVEKGDAWDQRRGSGGWGRAAAEKFVSSGFAMSMMVVVGETGTKVYEPRDGSPE